MNTDQEYIKRINVVKKYIDAHLTQKLSLSELASKAFFSPFHFQRIFKEVEDESPKQYIKRRRLEAIAHHLTIEKEPSILKIAVTYGFNSLQALSRAFKNQYGLSPKQFQLQKNEEKLRTLKSHLQRNISTKSRLSLRLSESVVELPVTVEKLSALKLIGLPVKLSDIESIKIGYRRIKEWAEAQEVSCPYGEIINLLNDYPAFTPLEKCRFHTCITVGIPMEVDEVFQYIEIPPRTYASFQFFGGIDALIRAVNYFANNWLPKNSYKIDHVPALIKPLQDPILNHPHEITYQIFIAISRKS